MTQDKRVVEFDYYISPDGEKYRFNNGRNRFLLAFEGLGMPDIDYIVQSGPFQHGETVIDYRLQPRIIQYLHRVNGNSRYDFWDKRSSLINVLRPNRQQVGQMLPGTLRKILPGGNVRDINVFIIRGPTFRAKNPQQWDEFGFTEALRFRAPDPTFFDPTQVCLQWTLETAEHLVFPFTFKQGNDGTGLLFGTTVIDNDLQVTYTGTWLTFPTIEVTGPITGLQIENVTTGEKIRLNYVVTAGEVVTITLDYGNKTVTSDMSGNLIGAIAEDESKLSTFHIAPAPEAPSGVNVINVSGGGATGSTAVELAYYTRYIGI